MTLRITTWNMNGIRNPFSYHPWSEKKSLKAAFDILQADIVCIQETKIQRKDLEDDMVLIPGWDCYYTFPKYKKGYSGVAIYTRQSKCHPIKAEEGLTGILEPPGHAGKTYLSLPPDKSIGGYPTLSREDALTLDSEGRCLVLDFGGFVLIGVYCPAARDFTRDEFRISFVKALTARVRNLVNDLERRVVVVGDLNIARDEIDSAMAKIMMKEQGLEVFKDTSTRTELDGFLKPHGDGVMVDLCREFFPEREGMYTCWDTRTNSRPANYGSRIDYILSSCDMKDWILEVDIQPELKGSDHCPVFATIKDKITIAGTTQHILDIVNPSGTFIDGQKITYTSEESTLLPLPKLSARLFTEFRQRRSVKDMFGGGGGASSMLSSSSALASPQVVPELEEVAVGTSCPQRPLPGSSCYEFPERPPVVDSESSLLRQIAPSRSLASNTPASPYASTSSLSSPVSPAKKRKNTVPARVSTRVAKSYKKTPSPGLTRSGGQQSLKGFFKPTATSSSPSSSTPTTNKQEQESAAAAVNTDPNPDPPTQNQTPTASSENQDPHPRTSPPPSQNPPSSQPPTQQIDEAATKSQWTTIFKKPPPPKCKEHREDCIQLITSKKGANFKRAFWICNRPKGLKETPKEKSQWRCDYFKWASEWNADYNGGGGGGSRE